VSFRSAAVRAAWNVEVLARRLRAQWSRSTDAPLSDFEGDRPAKDVTHSLVGYPRLLFWSASNRPQDFVRHDIPPEDRALVVYALVWGWKVRFYLGYADCRICGERLGTTDMAAHGMVYPQKAEHYLLEHDVWTPGCDELLRRLQSKSLT
jgi:hypothetical protein